MDNKSTNQDDVQSNSSTSMVNAEFENSGDKSNYCNFPAIDPVSINSIPFTEDDVHIQKSINNIRMIVRQAENINQSIQHFRGITKNAEYKFLEEVLIKLTLKLDAVESAGVDIIREERKNAIQYIQDLMKVLDSKLLQNKI